MSRSHPWMLLVQQAAAEPGVARFRDPSGCELAVHVTADATLLTLLDPDGRTGVEALMRARWQRPHQLGHWLPASLSDGQPALLAHLPGPPGAVVWPASGLDPEAAREVLR